MKPKVSIIVPVYNVEPYLRQCLNSLVNQSLKEIEILVINDGSPDNSQAIIDEFALNYPKVIKSIIKKNGGVSETRNVGIKQATGEYIGFVDSDDYIDSTMFEKLYLQAQKTGAEIVVCDYVKDFGDEVQQTNNINNWNIFNNSIKDQPKLLFQAKPYLWNKLYQRKFFLQTKLIFPVGQVFEDSAIIYQLLYLANKVAVVNEQLYFYRFKRDDSIINTVNENIFDIFKSCDSILGFFKKQPEYQQNLTPVIQKLCLYHLFARIKTLSHSNDRALTRRFINELYSYMNLNLPNWKQDEYFKWNKKSLKKSIIQYLYRHQIALYIFLSIPYQIRYKTRLLLRKMLGDKPKPKSQLSAERLRELQLIELDILLAIDNICKKHQLTYYLAEGTLLGAVRHHGFIPWDDDLDISMLREDYEHFLNIVEKELPNELVLLHDKTFKKYYLPFAKIVTTQTRGFYNNIDIDLNGYLGPYIDIFPIDTLEFETSDEQYNIFKQIRFYRDLLLLKINYKRINNLKTLFKKIIAKLLPFSFLQFKVKSLSTKSNNSENKFAANLASTYPPVSQIVPIEYYGTPQFLPFEGHELPVPQEYHNLLTVIYGDYKTPPPKHRQIQRHSFFDQQNKGK